MPCQVMAAINHLISSEISSFVCVSYHHPIRMKNVREADFILNYKDSLDFKCATNQLAQSKCLFQVILALQYYFPEESFEACKIGTSTYRKVS